MNNDILLIDPRWVEQYKAKHERFFETAKQDDIKAGYYTPAFTREQLTDAMLTIDGDIAIIVINGVLTPDGPTNLDVYFGEEGTSYGAIQDAFLQADELLPPGAEIHVSVSSPGGTVEMVEETATVIQEISAKRPVIMHVGYMAASAMYWLASKATRILATGKTTSIGSIGVIVSGWDWTKALDNFGIKIYNLTNPESSKKAATLATEGGRDVIVERLSAFYQVFLGSILDGRGKATSKEQIESLEGRVVLAGEALRLGLIDGIEGASISILDKNSEMSQNDSTPATAGNNKQEIDMSEKTLQELISSSPAVGQEVKDRIAKAVDEAKGVVRAEFAERVKAAEPYLSDKAYPDAIKALAAKVIGGEEEVATLKATVTVFDANKEQLKIDDAKKETDDDGDTPASDADAAKATKKMEAETALIKNAL